ncbi:MAG TPA: sigma-70 family RNA polymerase sigma factor, partial [Actinomycetota bacterium]|nr:sigma-70 family RNA polymerase sigma factor [Actinomycetota bacterium]
MTAPFVDDTIAEDLPPASPDDKEMALAFQRGEKGAYQLIYERYEDRVQRVCRRMLGKPEDAQEAAQEAFLRVYTALGKFNGRYHLGAWITRIATNVCLDHIRARSRRPVEPTPIEELELDFVASGESDPETVTVRNAESRRVRKVLLGLPPLHRAAIVLRDFEGLSYAEVAVALGMTEGQVKALIHRARKGFRRSWTPLAEMLVPARLLQRWRETDVTIKEHVVNAAASQSAPVASICSGVLQQCGTFVVHKMVPLGTTLILGGGSALAGIGSPPVPPVEDAVVRAAQGETGDSPGELRAAPRRDAVAEDTPQTAPPEPSATPPTVTASPEPTEPPAPSESPSALPATASPPPPSGTVTPRETTATPAPFAPELYFQQGQIPSRSAPAAHTVRVDCATGAIDQTMSAHVSDHEGSYPIELRLKTGSTFEITFTVQKKGFAVNYTGGGVLISRSNSGNESYLTFNGRYGSGGTAADSAGLPVNGSIRIELALDCSAQSLITESVVL